MFTKEFFNQRSFEVVWAVFRVAEYVKREKMREVLENKALEYIYRKDLESLASLEDVVRLAVNIKEISQINGKVILREIDNLRQAIFDISAHQNRTLIEKDPEKAPNVETIFSKPPVLASEFSKILKEVSFFDNNHKNNPAMPLEKSGKAEVEKDKENSQNFEVVENNPAIANKKSGNVNSVEDKQMAILETIKERVFCRLRDLIALYPEMSERTLRYNIQKLIDKGLIERVGSGPGSFLKLKKASKLAKKTAS